MTDFYAQLEEQLLTAGRRRQTQGRVRRAVAGRGHVLLAGAAGALAVGVAVALPAVRETSPAERRATPAATAPERATPVPAGPLRGVSLAGVRVAVFNATPFPGLARRAGDELQRRGAVVATFGSGPARTASIVLYTRGAAVRARGVATVLGVTQVRPYDTATAGVTPPPAARANVIVVIGYDRQTRPEKPTP